MTGKNILFSSIFDLTRMFHRMGESLERKGHRVFWFTTNRNWYNWLLEQGVDSTRIKALVYSAADFVSDEEKERLRAEMVACEADSDLTFNQTLLMDRFVLRLQSSAINEYVYLYYRDIKTFLQANCVDLVFGEPTNLNDLTTYQVCRELDIPYIAVGDMRFPTGRTVFSEGYSQARLVPTGGVPDERAGELFLKEFRESRQRPTYFEHWNRQPTIIAGKLMKSIRDRIRRGEVTRQSNLTHHTVTERLSLLYHRIVNGFYLRHITRYTAVSSIPGRIAFFGLHVQPESSIDVRGSYFSDQIKLIKDIRRALPFDTTLVVKEHPNFLGIRGPSFFREVRRIPNVVLVKHDVSTFEIFERCDVVFTVSGTIAYEAGMLGVPAVTFSPIYFDQLSSVHYCSEITALKRILVEIREGQSCDFESDCKTMSQLIADSFEGRWADPFNYPTVLEKDNVEKLERAFHAIVENGCR